MASTPVIHLAEQLMSAIAKSCLQHNADIEYAHLNASDAIGPSSRSTLLRSHILAYAWAVGIPGRDLVLVMMVMLLRRSFDPCAGTKMRIHEH
jgi:hypothetical protein